MKYPEKIRVMNQRFALISGSIILLIGVLSVFEAISRSFFKSPTSWTSDISQYLLCFAIFFVAGYAFQEQGHVRVDLLTRILPLKVRCILSIISHLVCLAFIINFTYNAVLSTKAAIDSHALTYAFIQIPKAVLMFVMLFGCLLMIIALISILIDLFGKGEKYL